MSDAKIGLHLPQEYASRADDVLPLVEEFIKLCNPLEAGAIHLLADRRTGAIFCECHILASVLLQYGTVDVPLDPEEQPEYRANREIVEDHVAYERMCQDAKGGRSFSNLVVEFRNDADEGGKIEVIGGQHRFEAIAAAKDDNVDELHGIKVYFALDMDQRLDVQLISNTNIAVSNDLLDRMYETSSGPELRTWCQSVGLLDSGQDFADKRGRSTAMTVRAARTFIRNYLLGREIDPNGFQEQITTPIIAKTGYDDAEWNKLKKEHP